MNKLILVLFGISIIACNPGGNKANIPVEEEVHAIEKHTTESTKEHKADSTTH